MKPLLLACPECDDLQHVPEVKQGQRVHCVNCGKRLYHNPDGGLERSYALLLGALLLFMLANAYPLVALEINGLSRDTTLMGTVWALYQADMRLLGALVFFTSILAPGLILGSLLYVLTGLVFHRRLPAMRGVLVFISRLHPWEMADVFLLSILVALVKLSSSADVLMDRGLFALAGMIVLAVAGTARLDGLVLWEKLEWLQSSRRSFGSEATDHA